MLHLTSTLQNGLAATPKRLDEYCFVCDERGSELFDKICQNPAYYTYRNDYAVIKENVKEISQEAGKGVTVVDIGCGLCHKSIYLLEALEEPAGFIGLDIESQVLETVKEKMKVQFPNLPVHTIVSDFMEEINLPEGGRKLGMLAGSIISVYSDKEVAGLIKKIMESLGDDGSFLVSYDTNQSPTSAVEQYMKAGYTPFILNALNLCNNQYGTNFDVSQFKFVCHWNEEEKQIEQLCVAQSRQVVTLNGSEYVFEKGESLRIYFSRKRSPEEFAKIVESVGYKVKRVFLDNENLICLSWIAKA